MRPPLRQILMITAALAVLGACATKPPPAPESTSAPPPTPPAQVDDVTVPGQKLPTASPSPAVRPSTQSAQGASDARTGAAAGTVGGRGGTGRGRRIERRRGIGRGGRIGDFPRWVLASEVPLVRAASVGAAVALQRMDLPAPLRDRQRPPAHAQTAEERRAVLDKQLNDSLGSFDARLRKEQQKIAQERDARQATVATSTASASDASSSTKPGSDQTADATGSTATEDPEKASGGHSGRTGKRGDARLPRAGDLKSDKSGGANGSANGNGASANEIPDGNDDDVVARRLRKAAEQETDSRAEGQAMEGICRIQEQTRSKWSPR